MTSPRVVIVGAGIAGASCAHALLKNGITATVLDRGRAPGGRMASPLLNGRRVDVGASYFTVADTAFQQVVDDWRRRGLVRPWTDTFDTYEAGTRSQPKTGPLRWAAPGGLRSLVRDLLVDQQYRSEITVDCIEAREPWSVAGLAADIVVLAMPDPQAARIVLASPDLAPTRWLDYEPVLAVTTAWSEREWPFADAAFVNDDPVLSFLADDGARRGDGAPVLVAHTTALFAADHLHDPNAAIPAVLSAIGDLIEDSTAPIATSMHRWSFAKPIGTHGDLPFLLTDRGIALTGDSWCPEGAPRVESAWLSGTRLADAIVNFPLIPS